MTEPTPKVASDCGDVGPAGPWQPDFGPTAQDYRRHRAGFPPQVLAPLRARGIGLPDQHVVDVGTGTGALARLLAPAVGSMRGIDPSQPLLTQAEDLAQAQGLAIEFTIGTAEATGLADQCADVVTVGQAWHWFDGAAAAREVRRILRPGGKVAIVHFDWIPVIGPHGRPNAAAVTEELILAANPAWPLAGGAGLYPQWLRDLASAGFGDLSTFSFDLVVPYSIPDWVGRVRASAGIGGALPADQVALFSDRLTDRLAAEFGAELAAESAAEPTAELGILHRTWATVGIRD
jgi:SAM-dependent methyltransferase